MTWIDPYFWPLAFIAAGLGLVAWIAIDEYRWRKDEAVRNLERYYEEKIPAAVEKERKAALKLFAILAVVALVACNVVLVLISWAAAGSMSRTGTYTQAASSFGLEAGKEYPLVIGGTLYGGADGTVTSYGGHFSARNVTDLRPATSVNLVCSYNGNSWVATISTEIITFHPDNDKAPSMSVEFANKSYGPQGFWDNETTTSFGISNGALGIIRQYDHPDITLTDAGFHDGLALIMNQGVSHVDITLPQSLLDEIANLK